MILKAEEYKEIPDEELIGMIRDGDRQAMDFLMDKYKDMVKSRARSMFILGGDSQDLIQEGMIGLFKAIRDYDSGRDASFRTFAALCISRQLFTVVQSSGRKKNIPLNTALSLRRGIQPAAESAAGGSGFRSRKASAGSGEAAASAGTDRP